MNLGVFTPADKADDDYRLVPFDVPPGVRRLEVRYAFDEDADQIIDLGLFDPRGAAFMAGEGFRGWSGSARRHVVLTETAATPGYLPGPILPGRWHVILGLYRIATSGCACTVEVTLSDEPGDLTALCHAEQSEASPATEEGMATQRRRGAEEEESSDRSPLRLRGSALPSSESPAWFAGDLQSHTHHSDARGSVADMAVEARARGLDFVAITDHNTISQQTHLAAHSGPDLLLLPAQEVTTNYGHLNAWGAAGWLDFRARSDADMARIIAEGRRRGLLVSANHPRAGDCPWTYSLDLPFDCFEVWNGTWSADNARSLALWDGLLRGGRRVVAVGGSDHHLPDPGENLSPEPGGLGQPTTWVCAERLDTEAILAAVRAGHVFIAASPRSPRLLLTAKRVDAFSTGIESRYPTLHDVVMQGDCLPGGEVAAACRVAGDVAGVLLLITAQGVVARHEAPPGESCFDVTLDLAAHRYIRAELREAGAADPAEAPLLALTNPVCACRADG